MDKSLPQEVRDMADIKANEIERKAAGAAGVRLAKGGMPMVEKAGKKVPEFAADGVGKMAKGGAVKKMMYGGMASDTMMAKGGAVRKYGMGGFNPPVDKTKPLMDAMPAGTLSPRGAVTGGGRPAPMPKPIVQNKPKSAGMPTKPMLPRTDNPNVTPKPAGMVKPMMAKGGAVKKDDKKAAPKKMMYGGALPKELPIRGQRTATNMMSKGGVAKKAKK
jgi:hypothetical protein